MPFESEPVRQPRHASLSVPGFAVAGQRLFFDPTAALKRKSDIDFLDAVAGSRWPGSLPELGELSGHEVVMIESLHAGLDARPGEAIYANAASLPIAMSRQHEIVAWVDTQADRTVAALVEVTDELQREHAAHQAHDPELPPLEPPLVLGSMVMAATAHYGEKRRSGRDYYEHPREMSLMLEAAWHRLFGSTRLSERNRRIAGMLVHDVEEATIDPKRFGAKRASGRYVFENQDKPMMTPMIIEKLALAVGEAPVHARQASLGNLAITRTRDAKGNKMPYRKVYIPRGIAIAGDDYAIDKVADFHHNRDLEPDPLGRPLLPKRKARQKQSDYNWSQDYIFKEAARRPVDYDLVKLLHYIVQTDQAELEVTKAQWAPFDHRDAGHRVLTKLGVEHVDPSNIDNTLTGVS